MEVSPEIYAWLSNLDILNPFNTFNNEQPFAFLIPDRIIQQLIGGKYMDIILKNLQDSYEKLYKLELNYIENLNQLEKIDDNKEYIPNSVKYNNWHIINDCLSNFGLNFKEEVIVKIINGDKNQLIEILKRIYELVNECLKFSKENSRENSPNKLSNLNLKENIIKQKSESISIKKIDPNKKYSNIESPLEFFIISLCKNLKLNPRQSIALLSNNRKYLIKLCNKGIKGDYEKIRKWLRDISLNTQTILYLSKKYEDGINITYATISSALCSKDLKVVISCSELLNKIQSEIGICWNWFCEEGIDSFFFAINKHNSIVEKLLSILSDFIKGKYDEFIDELNKKIINNEKKKIFDFISSILPVLKNIKNENFINLMENFIFKLCFNEKDDIALSVSILGDSFYYFYPIEEITINKILGYFSNCIQNENNLYFYSTITQIFSLLEKFGCDKNKYAPPIYKKVVFMFLKIFDNEIYKEFILCNFEYFFNNHQTVPINIFMDPYINKIKNSSEFYFCDLIFIFKIIEHPRISNDNLIEIIEIILDICLSNSNLQKIANLILSLIFEKELIENICSDDDINYLSKLFINYIEKSLQLYNLNPIENCTILETPYDIINENFSDVNEQIYNYLVNAYIEYRKNNKKNSNSLLGLLWWFPNSDDVILSNEEIYRPIYEPRKSVEKRLREQFEEAEKRNYNKKNKNVLNNIVESKRNILKQQEDYENEKYFKEINLKKHLEKERRRSSIQSGKFFENNFLLTKIQNKLKQKNSNLDIKKENISDIFDNKNQNNNLNNIFQKATENLKNKKVYLRSLSAVNINKINKSSSNININIPNNINSEKYQNLINKINIIKELIHPEGTIIKKPYNRYENNLSFMSQKIRNNYITSEVYKNFIIPVNLNTEENREIIAINGYNNQYKKNIRLYFRSYSNEVTQKITKSNFFRLFRELGFDKYKINLEEFNISIRNIFGENLTNFTFEEFLTLLIQLSYLIYTKTRDTLTISECYGSLIKKFKIRDNLTNAIDIIKDKMDSVIDLINKRIEKKKEYNLPPGFKLKEKTRIVYQNRLSPHIIKYIGESKFICYQILEDIIFRILNSSIIEPYVKIIKTNEIEIETGEIHKWNINLTKEYVKLNKEYEKIGIIVADILEDGLEKICKNKDNKGNLIVPPILIKKNEENCKFLEKENLKEESRLKRRIEIKKQMEEYNKIKLKIKKEREDNKEKERLKRLKELNEIYEKIKESDKKKAQLVLERKKKIEEENKNRLLMEEEEKKKKENEKSKKRMIFFSEQKRKLKEQFKLIKDKREENYKNLYNMQLSVQLNSLKTNTDYLKKDKDYIEFEKDLNITMKKLLEREDIKNVINNYKKHLSLIYEIYSKIGYNKISFFSNEAIHLNEFNEFLNNFTVLGLLITTDQMIYIYNKITQSSIKERDNCSYFTFDDFILSIGYLSIFSKFSDRSRKILPSDIENCNGDTIQNFFNYIGLKLPYNKLEIEKFINSRRSMNAKNLLDLQKEIKKEKIAEYKKMENPKVIEKDNNNKNDKSLNESKDVNNNEKKDENE